MNIICSNDYKRIEEVVNEAVSSQSDFFMFRMPSADKVCYATKCNVTSERPDIDNLFVVSTFDGKLFYFTEGATTPSPTRIALPDTTAKETYLKGARRIIAELQNSGGKTVYSRVERRNAPDDIGKFYADLLSDNKNAYVFIFRAAELGIWIGASPELLLCSNDDDSVESIALAGTRQSSPGSNDDAIAKEWDGKNIEEQQLVTDAIVSDMRKCGYTVKVSSLTTRKAGAVEHLCRRITGIPEANSTSPLYLAQTLAPTPALCGYPREISLERIAATEKHPRSCYGGFSGYINSDDKVNLYVTLRCAVTDGNTFVLYLGGGLTQHSDAEKEWEETCIKSLWYKSQKNH